ncbi:uncharacterized protein [Montipora foliosa]|uniref:uncharacterized protein n=1 Tax=Montipora foliosa TaxID=591990 RepID=UPI0035F1133F
MTSPDHLARANAPARNLKAKFPPKNPPSEQNASDSEDCQTLMEKNTQEGHDSDSESEDDILAEMQKEYEAEDSIGKDIQNPQLAKLLGKMFRSRLPDKVLKDKLEGQERPENCETAKPTRVNPGIWRTFREPTQKRDLQLHKMQLALVKGIMPVAHLTDFSMTEKKWLDKEGAQQIKQDGLDALSLLTRVNYELNMQRRQLMKPDIGKDYASLCSQQIPFTDYLFGDDLQKQSKDIGDVNKIGAKVQASRGPQRSSSGYGNNTSSRGSFSHGRSSKNFKGQTSDLGGTKERQSQ